MKILEFFKKNYIFFIMFICIFSIQYLFVCQKDGYHMDEVLSYELSNAQFNPWIVPTQPVGRLAKLVNEEIKGDTLIDTFSNIAYLLSDTLRNRGNGIIANYKADVYEEPVFISREQFHNYVTTGDGDRFNLFSVYFNVKDDNHPPVHFMLLHLISSVFKNKWTPFMGCLLNALAIMVTCLASFKLLSRLENENVIPSGSGKISGIIFTIIYSLSAAGISSMLLIRMYALVAMFGTLYFCIVTDKYYSKENSGNVFLCVVTVLGFLTQYFFLFIVIPTAIVFVLFLIKDKRYADMRRFVHTMGVSAIIAIVCYPFSIGDVLFSGRGVEAVNNLTGGIGEWGIRLVRFARLAFAKGFGIPTLLFLATVCVLACVILVKDKEKNSCYVFASLVATVAVYFLTVSKAAPMYEDRYLMPVYPIICLLLVVMTCICMRRESLKRVILIIESIVTLYCVVRGTVFYNGEYLFKGYGAQLDVAVSYQDMPCICVHDGDGFYYNLPEFEQYEKTLIITNEELENRIDTDSIKDNSEFVLMVKGNVDEAITFRIMEEMGCSIEKELLLESAYGDNIYLMKTE